MFDFTDPVTLKNDPKMKKKIQIQNPQYLKYVILNFQIVSSM